MTRNDATSAADGGRAPAAGELMTVDEAIARFRGEWVLMKVTERDADHWPSKGYVLAHSPKREGVSAALAAEPPPSALPPDAPREPYYVFLAYPRARSGPAYEAAVLRFLTDLIRASFANGARGARTDS